MKTGTRFHQNASCKITFCAAIPNQLRAKTREVSCVDVPENLRKQGMATQLLKNVCDEADAGKIILLLFVKPFGGNPSMDKEQLIEWYANKFGFAVIQTKPSIMMARMPFATPGYFKPTLITSALQGQTK